MDKKDLENLFEIELRALKDSSEDVISDKRFKKTINKTNSKSLAFVWIAIAIAISLYRYFSM